MAKTLQFRRGTTSELSSVTGSVGELFVNTEKDTVVVMDGSTSGGFELVNLNASQTLTNKTLTSPVISTISNTGTLTLPTSTGTIALTSDIPTNNNALTNGAGYITASSTDTLTNKSGNISQWTNDAGYLTSFTETNDLTASVTWANVPDANITQSSVTQHQAALSVTESQISDLQSYITATSTDTLTNKTLTSPTITGTGAIAGIFTGNITGDVTGNADTATTLETARTIGGVSFDGSANINLPGVNTTGNQDTSGNAATATALETARTIAGQSFDGTANITIAATDLSDTDQSLSTTDNVTFNDLTVSGNLTVSGTTTTVNTETINLADNTITLNSNETGTPSQDGGIEIERGTSTNKTLVWNETTDKWTVGSETFVAGTFEGNLTGDVTGNADTATALETARTIAGQSFDGTANITIASTDLSNTSNITLNDATQTLTNKTLTSPVISTISNTGTLTLPTSTGTVALTSDIPTNNNQLTNGAGYLTSFTETNDLTASVTWANIPDANVPQSAVTQHQAALSVTESQISDLQSYLTSETNDLTASVTWTNVPDANITQSSVTQHQAALSITESQISDLQSYLTSETNDLTASVTWANVPDANITQSSVTQHQAALSITESQISDLGSYITASSSDTLTNKTLDNATLTGTLTAGGGVGTSGQVLKSTGTGVEWGTASAADTNTTYNVSAVDSGDNAIIRLTGSDASTDDVTLAAGSNITITPSGDTITIASTAGSSYTDSDVDTHLNTSTASSGEVLSWNGSDYDWVAQSGGGSSLTIQDEGSTLSTAATTLNFTGSGVTASGTGSTKIINISGGASTIGALNDVTITSPAINQVLKYNGSAWVNAADATGSGSADLGAVAEDILPSFDEVYDIGSSTFKWYDGFFTNSINIDTISLTNSSGTLAINSDLSVTGDVVLGSLLVDSLLLSENTITADASTAIQYLGDKGVVEINSSNLDVREGDWIGVPVVETTNSVPPLTTGAEGIIRYNKDEGRFEGYNAEGWASLGGLETNADGDNIITGNLVVSGDITSTSDETLKDNIKSIEGALDIVTKLSGKMFTMKSDETQKEKVGFIAQEIEQHLPQVVSTDPNGIKSVSYGNVTALLVEAIKELNQKIEDLKK